MHKVHLRKNIAQNSSTKKNAQKKSVKKIVHKIHPQKNSAQKNLREKKCTNFIHKKKIVPEKNSQKK